MIILPINKPVFPKNGFNNQCAILSLQWKYQYHHSLLSRHTTVPTRVTVNQRSSSEDACLHSCVNSCVCQRLPPLPPLDIHYSHAESDAEVPIFIFPSCYSGKKVCACVHVHVRLHCLFSVTAGVQSNLSVSVRQSSRRGRSWFSKKTAKASKCAQSNWNQRQTHKLCVGKVRLIPLK